MRDILARLRKYQIRIRKAVTTQMHGDFHSVFKGNGLEFSDLRAYQYGDDVRTIDWSSSAKGHGTFVKLFREEREQTVFFLVDVSASQQVGRRGQAKIDLAKELCGVLALSALQEKSQVGLVCFSDQKEKYVPPGKGLQQGYLLVSTLFKVEPQSLQTDLKSAIGFVLNLLRRRSVVVVISDFIDRDYEPTLKAMAKKHDLVVIHLLDRRETALPRLGIIPVFDQESGRMVWRNTSSPHFQRRMKMAFQTKQTDLERLCRRNEANYLAIHAEEDFVPLLVKLFRVRNA